MKIFTEQQMRRAEQAAADGGMAFLRLMENAGSACAAEIRTHLRPGRKTVILCGKGKNGGDGFVIARKLAEAGFSAVVLLVYGKPTDEDALYMFGKLSGTTVHVFDLTQNDAPRRLIGEADILVDAIFGIGFHGEADETLSALFREINDAKGKVFAVDLPSGLECDSAEVRGETIRADYTLAISAGKPCHVLLPAAKRCGTVVPVRIGVEDTHYKNAPYHAYTFSKKEARAAFPKRPAVSNKGDFGKVLCICGSVSFAGAAALAAESALRSGAGLVYAAFPQSAYPAISAKLTEAVLLPMPEDSEGRFAASAIPRILGAMQGVQAIVLGCGLGQSAGTRELVEAVLLHAACPVILDADGINLIRGNIDILRKAKAKLILTPHPGEMARLLGCSVEQVQRDRVGTASAFAAEYGVTLVLKGANTVVASPKGGAVFLGTTGNSGLAKGGSGDFLAGLMGGFAAQGVRFAAETAVYIHGLCGERTAKRYSMRGMLPTDCICELPDVLSEFE
ncbi:MAG: NAD(P)H-hydrate dehydratase [Clostridia bacterium]|nr:NAD(P)H-hydrate dehydratase [Clostridia bacterium]